MANATNFDTPDSSVEGYICVGYILKYASECNMKFILRVILFARVRVRSTSANNGENEITSKINLILHGIEVY